MTRRKPLAVALALLAVAPAAASAADRQFPERIPVADGQLEHTVRTAKFEANYTVPGAVPWSTRIETWVTKDRARQVSRDARTGELAVECAETLTEQRCFNADENEITIVRKDGSGPGSGIFTDSWAREALLIRRQVDMGWFAFGEDTTFAGQPARTLHKTDAAVGESRTHDLVVEPDTLYPLRRVITGGHDGRDFTQTDEVVSREVLSPDAAQLTLSAHPGAKVKRIGDKHAASAAARKRAAAKRKAAAKRRAAKRRAAAGRRAPARR